MTDRNEGGELLPFPNRARMKAEAGAWLARLDQGPLTTEEAANFRAWAQSSREHREYLEKMARTFDSMAGLQQLADIFPLADVAAENGHVRTRSPRILRTARWIAAAAAVAGLYFAITLLRESPVPAPNSQEFATAVGEQANHTLEDGSIITLNTHSRVSVKYTDRARAVYLLEGEASFDVTKDAQRHFIVYAGSGFAEALGTSFNVRLVDGVVDVTVTHGVVRVLTNATHALPVDLDSTRATASSPQTERTKDRVVLAAGQSARFDKLVENLDEAIPPDVLDRKLAWRDGAIIFSGETLQAALVEISRYTNKSLVIVDPRIADIRIGGRYKTDDIGALLAALSASFGIKAEEDAAGRILLSAKSG